MPDFDPEASAQEIPGKAGMDQCWCDLTRNEIGCYLVQYERLRGTRKP